MFQKVGDGIQFKSTHKESWDNSRPSRKLLVYEVGNGGWWDFFWFSFRRL